MRIKNMALVATVLFVPSLVLASGAEHHDISMFNSDFFYRVLNFSVFMGILYYLAANPIKAFFEGRSKKIANQLEEIEAKLQASENERIAAQENLHKAEEKVEKILSDAELEAKMLSEKIIEKTEVTLTLLEKQALEKQELETKKATRKTINAVLDEGITTDDITVDETKVVSLISNKVA